MVEVPPLFCIPVTWVCHRRRNQWLRLAIPACIFEYVALRHHRYGAALGRRRHRAGLTGGGTARAVCGEGPGIARRRPGLGSSLPEGRRRVDQDALAPSGGRGRHRVRLGVGRQPPPPPPPPPPSPRGRGATTARRRRRIQPIGLRVPGAGEQCVVRMAGRHRELRADGRPARHAVALRDPADRHGRQRGNPRVRVQRARHQLQDV